MLGTKFFCRLLLAIVVFLANQHFSLAKLVKHVFEIDYISGSPDGVKSNWILTANKKFPGPTIYAELGDTLQVDVVNSIKDRQNTTIHWHGIHQFKTPFEDGPSMVTQCPVKFGRTHSYKFELKQGGTFWYHSHQKSQSSEGLWGAIVVKNKKELFQYDGEILITLSDWYHNRAKENDEWFFSNRSNGDQPHPDSLLLNGKGRYPCDISRSKGLHDCDVMRQKRQIFEVRYGKIYRVRVINTSSRTNFKFSIDHHKLNAIEVDGEEVAQSVESDFAEIAPAQRYSFLIKTTGDLDRYLVRAGIATPYFRSPWNINPKPEALITEVTAVLQYNRKTSSNKVKIWNEVFDYSASSPEIPKDQRYGIPLKEQLLLPRNLKPAPEIVNQEIILNANIIRDIPQPHFAFNRTKFELPTDKPILHKLMDGDLSKEQLPSTYIELKYGNTVQLVINNYDGNHPFHLHGHTFWVVGKFPMQKDPNTGKLSGYDAQRDSKYFNTKAPKRDTVWVEQGHVVVIRWKADNPGVWTMHCHIDWHNLGGMAVVFIEGEQDARNLFKISDKHRSLCK